MEGYSAKVEYVSWQATPKELVQLKSVDDTVALDTVVTPDERLRFTPFGYAKVAVHNEKSDNKDYYKYLIKDIDGTIYTTGSESFMSTFSDIYEEMEDYDEDYEIECYKRESKNYKGKYFLTCKIV